MRIKFLKWYIHLYAITIKEEEHHCLNQIMDGSYDCEYCRPDLCESKEADG